MAGAPVLQPDSNQAEAIDVRQVRAAAFRTVRQEFVEWMTRDYGVPPGARVLVVGGGKGIVPRDLSRAGFDVVAVDPSSAATAVAERIAAEEGQRVEEGQRAVYRTAPAVDLGVPEGAFDLAYYVETFEITPDLDSVVRQAAKALRPGGVLLYDTVNRTLPSRLVYLGAFQRIPFTRIAPPGRYHAARLRTPEELRTTFGKHGLRSERVIGFKPAKLSSLVSAVRARRRGAIGDDEVGSTVSFVLDVDGPPVVTYFGAAVREPAGR